LKSATGNRHVQFNNLRGELEWLAAGDFKLGDCAGRPAASRPETLQQLLEFSMQNHGSVASRGWWPHGASGNLPRRAFVELKNTGAATLKGFLNLAAAAARPMFRGRPRSVA